jgi:MoxR-like ATPase
MNERLVDFETAAGQLQQLRTRMESVVIGQPAVVEHVLCALLARGHVLLEGVPGLAKTLHGAHARRQRGARLRAHPVHARPDAQRTSSGRTSSTCRRAASA